MTSYLLQALFNALTFAPRTKCSISKVIFVFMSPGKKLSLLDGMLGVLERQQRSILRRIRAQASGSLASYTFVASSCVRPKANMFSPESLAIPWPLLSASSSSSQASTYQHRRPVSREKPRRMTRNDRDRCATRLPTMHPPSAGTLEAPTRSRRLVLIAVDSFCFRPP